MGQTVHSILLKGKGSIGEMSILVDTMASKHGHVDKGCIRNIMVVMKRNSKGAVLVDLRSANLYQGMSTCTTGMLRLWLSCH